MPKLKFAIYDATASVPMGNPFLLDLYNLFHTMDEAGGIGLGWEKQK